MNTAKWKAFRQSLHSHPETAFEELNTAGAIRDQLEAMGHWQITYPVGKTGLLAELDSGNPGPGVMLRAELDALPIREESLHSYSSRISGLGHLCGHDGHATILLVLAEMLVRKRPGSGKVYLLFQPAEETGAGARAVLDDPSFASCRPDWIFGLHNLPGKPMHEVILRNGPFNAAVCSMVVHIAGQTSHAGEPDKGRNPAEVIGQALLLPASLNETDTTRADYRIASPVYARLGSKAYGTSAGDGEIHFTLRTWDQEGLTLFREEMEAGIRNLAAKDGLELRIEYTEFFPPIHNTDKAVELIAAAAAVAGMEVSYSRQPFTWGEDFGYFTDVFSGAFFGLGAGVDTAALHRPDYDFPDVLLESGPTLFRNLIDHILQKEETHV